MINNFWKLNQCQSCQNRHYSGILHPNISIIQTFPWLNKVTNRTLFRERTLWHTNNTSISRLRIPCTATWATLRYLSQSHGIQYGYAKYWWYYPNITSSPLVGRKFVWLISPDCWMETHTWMFFYKQRCWYIIDQNKKMGLFQAEL